MTALIAAALAAAMFYLSQGIDAVWSLAWVAPLPLLWLAYGGAPRWQVFAAGVAAFAAGQVYMFLVYGPALLTTALAMAIGCGAAFGGTLLLARQVHRDLPPMAALFAFPAIWTAFEYLVGLVSPHGSWGAMGYSQVAFPPAIQVASLFGLYAVTFLLCLFANALALAAHGRRVAGWVGVGLSVLCLLYGQARLILPQAHPVKVAALSDWPARLRASRKLDEPATHAMAEEYARAARDEAQKGARMIVIPEGAMVVDPAWRRAALMPLADAARDTGATIVAGVLWVKPWRNTAIAFQPDGGRRVYDKRHLLSPFEDKFTPGRSPGLLGRSRAVAICKDLDFPRTLRADAVAGGAEGDIRILAVPASDFVADGWIHARMAVMRGVENGFAVVRSAFKGLETVSDAQGRILARADTNAPGIARLRAAVPPGPGATLYTRIGDLFAWLCVAAALAVVAAAFRVRKPEG
jgi:apolipoprotein N-acyltransferase